MQISIPIVERRMENPTYRRAYQTTGHASDPHRTTQAASVPRSHDRSDRRVGRVSLGSRLPCYNQCEWSDTARASSRCQNAQHSIAQHSTGERGTSCQKGLCIPCERCAPAQPSSATSSPRPRRSRVRPPTRRRVTHAFGHGNDCYKQHVVLRALYVTTCLGSPM